MIFTLILLTGFACAYDLGSEIAIDGTEINQTEINQTEINQTEINQTEINQTTDNNSASIEQEWFEAVPVAETPQNMTDQETISIWPAYKNPFKPGSDLSKFGKQQIRNYQ